MQTNGEISAGHPFAKERETVTAQCSEAVCDSQPGLDTASPERMTECRVRYQKLLGYIQAHCYVVGGRCPQV